MLFRTSIFLVLVGHSTTGLFGQQVSLSLDSAQGVPGSTVSLNLTMSATGGAQPTGLQWTIGYPASLTGVSVTTGAAAGAAGKSAQCSIGTGSATCVVYGMNTAPIGNGIVAQATFTIAAGTSGTTAPVSVSATIVSSGTGSGITSSGSGGTITILSPLPSLNSLSCSPGSVNAPGSSSCTVTLSGAAPIGGFSVGLSSNNGNVTVPASVTVPSGSASAGFTATVLSVTTDQTAVLTATANIVSRTFSLGVVAPVGNLPPTAVSVTPSSGSASTQTFGFLASDPNGFTDLSTIYMLVNATLNWPASCYTSYVRSSNTLWLLNDTATVWLGPLTPGGAGTLANSQCTLSAVGSSVSGSGNNLTVNTALTFSGGYAGVKNVYLNAQDNGGLWSNWVLRGAWTVPSGGNQPPSTVSVAPASGSGSGQTFSFLFSDPNGSADLSTAYMLINSALGWTGACYTSYDRGSNTLWLLNDSATFWLGPLTPGGAGTLANSQCTLNAGASSVSNSGNNLTVNVAFTFTGSFAGSKNVYMNGQDNGGLWSNWQSRGTWTVLSGGNQAPSAVSVTPASGGGSVQTFSFLFSDPDGLGDLSTLYMLVNATLNWPGSCYTSYVRSSNTLWLLNDAGNSWLGPVTPGGAGTLSNSRCAVNVGGSSVSGSGNNQTVTLPLAFTGAFAGVKNVYLNAQDNGGLWSNWQLLGTWTVK